MRIRTLIVLWLFPTLLLAGGRPRGRTSAPRSYSAPRTHTYKAPPAPRPTTSPKPTYQGGDGTRYIAGESYKSGMPKVDRSQGAKNEFLRERGLSKAPPGTQVDHIRPLSKGGADTPQNMQILTKEQHRQKTGQERREK